MGAEEGLTGNVHSERLFEDLRAGVQVQPPITACQGTFSCPP